MMPPKIPDYVKEKAIKLRVEKKLTDSEIAERLQVPELTISGWLEDYPLYPDSTPARKAAYQANRDRAAAKRQEAYDEGWEQAPELFKDIVFHHFICMYLAEGYKKSRNDVAIANSDPDIMTMAHYFMKLYANPENTMEYRIQIHIDQDEDEIKQFWGDLMDICPDEVKTMRKSNSGKLSGRNWRSQYGVLTIRIGDTTFRSKLEAWIDYLKKQWLDRFGKV